MNFVLFEAAENISKASPEVVVKATIEDRVERTVEVSHVHSGVLDCFHVVRYLEIDWLIIDKFIYFNRYNCGACVYYTTSAQFIHEDIVTGKLS